MPDIIIPQHQYARWVGWLTGTETRRADESFIAEIVHDARIRNGNLRAVVKVSD